MTHEPEGKVTDKTSLEERKAIRQEAGRCIDAATAKIYWKYGHPADPYGEATNLSDEEKHVGRMYFACARDSDQWISFNDLPEPTAEALQKRLDEPTTEAVIAHEEKVAATTGLEDRAAIRQEAGRRIDPATAEISWGWGCIIDPYGDVPDLSDEEKCIGRVYFFRAAGSALWVNDGDLPDPTREALWERMKKPQAVEPSWGSNEDYFFSPSRVLAALDRLPKEDGRS